MVPQAKSIYVVNDLGNSITIFPATANGNVAPSGESGTPPPSHDDE